MRKKILIVLIYMFLIFPFLEPPYISVNLSKISDIYHILVSIGVFLILIVYMKKGEFNKFVLSIIFFSLAIITICLFNDNLSKSVIFEVIKIMGSVLILNYGMKHNCRELLSALMFVLSILIIINFYTILKYPNGMYKNMVSNMTENFFLGMDNIHIVFILPYIMCFLIYRYIYNKHDILKTIVLIVCYLSIIIRFSVTTIVGTFIFTIFILLYKYLVKLKIFNIKLLTIIYIIAFFALIIFRVQNYFAFIIEEVLHKSLTFTGRTIIWDNSIYWIKLKPLIGYGYEITSLISRKIGAVHSHNLILFILYRGGFLLLGSFIYMISIVLRNLTRYKDEKIVKEFSIIIFSFFFMMLTEFYSFTYIVFILALANGLEYCIVEKRKINGIKVKS